MRPTKRENPASSNLLAVNKSSIASFPKCGTIPRIRRIKNLNEHERHHEAVNSVVEFVFQLICMTTCKVWTMMCARSGVLFFEVRICLVSETGGNNEKRKETF